MRTVFADTSYWLATVIPGDQWKEAAEEARSSLGDAVLLTTDEVLTEFLNALGNRGPALRQAAVRMVRAIIENANVTVLPQTRKSFLNGLRFYHERPDKAYSLTDCISMNSMRSNNLCEVLTADEHFAQEGFTVLMRRSGRTG